ncbi:hypothetical protein RI054_45g154090 [Pseudoscourfieldia marina]
MAATSSSELPPSTPKYVIERLKEIRSSIPQPGNAVDRRTWPVPATLMPSPVLSEEPDAAAYAAGAADAVLTIRHVGARQSYVARRRWKCKECSKSKGEKKAKKGASWFSDDAIFMSELPPHVSSSYPALRTSCYDKTLVGRDLADFVRAAVPQGTLVEVSDHIRRTALDGAAEAYAMYLHHFNHASKQNSSQTKLGQYWTTTTSAEKTSTPASYEEVFAPRRLASPQWIKEAYLFIHDSEKDYKLGYVMNQPGQIFQFDMTFEESKHIRLVGDKVLAGILTMFSEFGAPVRQWMARTKSLHDLWHKLRAFGLCRAAQGRPVLGITVDDVEISEKILREAIPSVANGYGVRLDITHGQRRTLHTLAPRHPMTQAFMSDLTTAFYVVNQGDIQRVNAFFKAKGKKTGLSITEVRRSRAVRKHTRNPHETSAFIEKVLAKWQAADTTVPLIGMLITEDTVVEMKKLAALAAKGYMSDPQGADHHLVLKTKLFGELPQYRRIFSTSSMLEGYHPHLHKCLRDAPNHSPRFAAAKILDFNFAFTLRSRREFGEDAVERGVAQPWLRDEANRIAGTLSNGRLPFPAHVTPSQEDVDAVKEEDYGFVSGEADETWRDLSEWLTVDQHDDDDYKGIPGDILDEIRDLLPAPPSADPPPSPPALTPSSIEEPAAELDDVLDDDQLLLVDDALTDDVFVGAAATARRAGAEARKELTSAAAAAASPTTVGKSSSSVSKRKRENATEHEAARRSMAAKHVERSFGHPAANHSEEDILFERLLPAFKTNNNNVDYKSFRQTWNNIAFTNPQKYTTKTSDHLKKYHESKMVSEAIAAQVGPLLPPNYIHSFQTGLVPPPLPMNRGITQQPMPDYSWLSAAGSGPRQPMPPPPPTAQRVLYCKKCGQPRRGHSRSTCNG